MLVGALDQVLDPLCPVAVEPVAGDVVRVVVADDAVKPLAPAPAILEPEPVAAAASEE